MVESKFFYFSFHFTKYMVNFINVIHCSWCLPKLMKSTTNSVQE